MAQINFKAAHSFDPATGEYLGATLAQRSPLETDVYLLPAGATFIAPKEPAAGKWPFWTGAVWEIRAVAV
ncbi:hypothetical protein R6242_10760 [Iodobacter sp. CM08]|uniref:hypothetical protein n=1 Tax=Iodobacter sp. CM08 TaxID=3085902 RepID=UPI002981CC27|nr:hypothetical protein [Iodobacter sp. CM08]MDW5417045.1 hypothetical protein [Iodobacter sp. CM08]